MSNEAGQSGSVLYIPHGGGPLPLLGHPGHQDLVDFLFEITPKLGQPSAIVVISAHWEAPVVTITSGKSPQLIYDYYGFPEEAYKIKYPAPGAPELAKQIFHLLKQDGIEAKLDEQRGFDHGLFVPLKLMYPNADIPCVQISLHSSFDAESHINIGRALSALRHENLLVIGSGFSFHNMDALKSQSAESMMGRNIAFEKWLIETCTGVNLSPGQRESRLINWLEAPHARYCHPREEHLLPLHVCFGMANSAAANSAAANSAAANSAGANSAADLVFEGNVVGVKVSGYRW